MPIDLYYTCGSSACRFVLMVGAAVGVTFNTIYISLKEQEQFKAEFLKLNPQHTVPTINDNGFVLWESRSIARYLVNKYGAGTTLYPTNPELRAKIDQFLDFDLATLSPSFTQFFYPALFTGLDPKPHQFNKLQEALFILNKLLESAQYAVGSNLTIADLCLAATVSTMEATGIDLTLYPNIQSWFVLVKNTSPFYDEINGKGIEEFKQLVFETNESIKNQPAKAARNSANIETMIRYD